MPEDYREGFSELNREIVEVYLNLIRRDYPNID